MAQAKDKNINKNPTNSLIKDILYIYIYKFILLKVNMDI